MDYAQILAVSGRSGLYRYLSRARNGLLVESLCEGARQVIPLRSTVTTLKDIAIYTRRGEIPLLEVFESLQSHEEAIRRLHVRKDSAGVERVFSQAVPDYLRDRVRLSDMQKVFRWYLELRDAGAERFVKSEDDSVKGVTVEQQHIKVLDHCESTEAH